MVMVYFNGIDSLEIVNKSFYDLSFFRNFNRFSFTTGFLVFMGGGLLVYGSDRLTS